MKKAKKARKPAKKKQSPMLELVRANNLNVQFLQEIQMGQKALSEQNEQIIRSLDTVFLMITSLNARIPASVVELAEIAKQGRARAIQDNGVDEYPLDGPAIGSQAL